MSVYIIQGKLGNGKTLAAVYRIQEALKAGKRVATNLDIYPEHMISLTSKCDITRLPDKPRSIDLVNLGTGDNKPQDEYNEEKFGCLVLDELASWLNSRTWNDKERSSFVDWLLHSRKNHWDIYLIIQDIAAIDKQVRDMFCEHLAVAKRLDKIPVPLIGKISKLITGKVWTLPKMHTVKIYYGDNEQSMSVDRWTFTGKSLYPAYRTGQQFTQDIMFIENGETIDMRASYSVLSPYHTHGRYLVKRGIGQQIIDILNPLIQYILQPIVCLLYRLGWLRSDQPRRITGHRSTAYINGNM